MNDVAKTVSTGATPLKSRADYYDGDVPWLRTQEVLFGTISSTTETISEKAVAETGAKWVPAGSVVVAISGATAGRVGITSIPLTTNQHCCNLQIDRDQASAKYVFHWLCREYEIMQSLGRGARNDLNAGIIKAFPIPIPPLEEQERIVAVLDRFDALANDLTVGLPAELAARRKQYEYYRNRLLTFDDIHAAA